MEFVRLRGLVRRLLAVASKGRGSAPSGWYMNTGEGRAVAAGAEDVEGVDLGEVLDHRFRLAVQAVAEVNASGAVGAPDRFDRVQRAYQEKLGQVGPDA